MHSTQTVPPLKGHASSGGAPLSSHPPLRTLLFLAHGRKPCRCAANAGEIATLQAEALRGAIPRPGLPSLQLRLGALQQAVSSRAHLEASLSTALALQSPQEYRRWLLAYARFLAEQGDAGRLAEVCASLLGGAGGGGGDDTDMAEAAGSGGGEGGDAPAWQPAVLGLPKRDLLREVLKEMGRNRSLQRTTQTYLDALGELERAVERAEALAAAQRAAAAAAAGDSGGAAAQQSGALQPAAV